MIGNLTDEEIEEVLKENVLGRIGCNDGKKTYVVPINYAYNGQYVIAHSVDGMKIQTMRNNPNVCFEVDEMKSFTNWKSVMVWGQYHELIDERDKYNAIKFYIDRMINVSISETAIPPKIEETKAASLSPVIIKAVIYRIVISDKSGRYEK